MSPRARHAAVVAITLAACSPAVERRSSNSGGSVATAAAVADSTTSTTPTPASSAASAALKSGAPLAADSARGVVERIGSEATSQLIVRAANGSVCALGMPTRPPIEGLEVTLWGRRDLATATMIPGVACTFAAERYAVRAVDAVAAVDGILRADGSAWAIETADGARRPLREVPSRLRTQAGARIYWAGPLDRAPAAYGVLQEARP